MTIKGISNPSRENYTRGFLSLLSLPEHVDSSIDVETSQVAQISSTLHSLPLNDIEAVCTPYPEMEAFH